MKRALAAFAAALSYFTIVPLGRFSASTAPNVSTLSFLPIVGGLIGALSGTAGLCVWLTTHSALWMALAAWIASIALTGAIHVDGFLDSCDGLLVTATPSRRLEILRDSGHGTFAVVGMAMLSVVWIAVLRGLDPWTLPLVLALSESIARLAALGCVWVFPYARGRAMGPPPNRIVAGSVAAVIVALAALDYPTMLLAVLVVPAVALALGWWASRRLGGRLTGDVYGAAIVVGNVVALGIAALGVMTR
ncbi:MAG TPA: adenosylcobinamide-GDP ribazoletransferase [Candidatus Aquilonibacter sp.]